MASKGNEALNDSRTSVSLSPILAYTSPIEFIYVVKADASVEKRFIQTGPEVENATIVERGLNPNEIIVVEGQHKLSHGTKVKAL